MLLGYPRWKNAPAGPREAIAKTLPTRVGRRLSGEDHSWPKHEPRQVGHPRIMPPEVPADKGLRDKGDRRVLEGLAHSQGAIGPSALVDDLTHHVRVVGADCVDPGGDELAQDLGVRGRPGRDGEAGGVGRLDVLRPHV